MKKTTIQSIGIIIIIAGLFSCNDLIEDYYENPDETTEGEIGKLFTYMFYNDYIRPTYWDYRTFTLLVTAPFSQYIAVGTSDNMYVPNTSYTEDRWEGFYSGGIMNQYREMQKTYNELDESAQEEQYIFLQLAKIVLYDQACQIVDYWGDIPFSEAGSLNETNKISYAKFDDAEEIYTEAIASLDSINSYLANADLSSVTSSTLSSQDILLGGEVSLWRKYANSLRLRLLMRISNYSTSAQTAIATMLNNGDTYPLVDDNDENILLEMNPSSFNSDITSALLEVGPYAPYYMLNEVMLANNDPRVPVFWSPGEDSWDDQIYLGLESDVSGSEYSNLTDTLSVYDSLTFTLNWNLPGVLFTAAEVSFLKAEAYERWSLGDAQTEYEKGVYQSIEFYFDIQQSSYINTSYTFSSDPEDSPDSATVESYLEMADIAYSGTSDEKLEKIYTQKWLNFFILQAGQSWAEIRRTNYPDLPFAEDPLTGELPPSRLLYPDTEKSYNADNYAAVSGKDSRDTKIFWDVD